jgi:putative Mg2+ transporter-C (MgtC) family protein
MEFLRSVIESNDITWETALLRFLVSFLLGAFIGIEREMNNQPAGLRTHILISIGSTLVMLISIYIPQIYMDSKIADPGRIAAQVITGIGFLGAGAILKFGADIRGLTTAASIWVMAAVGLAVGAGMYVISFIGVGVVLFALTAMNIFEKKVFKARTFRKIELVLKKQSSDFGQLEQIFKKYNVKIHSTGFDRNIHESTDKLSFIVAISLELDIQKLADALGKLPGTVSVSVLII